MIYRSGQCRNDTKALSHTYAECNNGELLSMCSYGWNRDGGNGFSIFRGAPGTQGDCMLCSRNVASGKLPVKKGFKHKTRWL